jgi:hypothetical protein
MGIYGLVNWLRTENSIWLCKDGNEPSVSIKGREFVD